MNGSEIIRKFYSALPAVKNWIEDLLEERKQEGQVSTFDICVES